MHRSLGNRLILAILATFLGLAGRASAASDEALIRGQIKDYDAATGKLVVTTASGNDIHLYTDKLTQISIKGNPGRLDQVKKGQRVRAMFEKAAMGNHVISLRTSGDTAGDLTREIQDAWNTAKGYSFEKKQQYQAKMNDVLEDVDDRIAELQREAKSSGADSKSKLQQQIDELKKKREQLAEKLNNAKPAAKDAWDDFKNGVSNAAEDLQRSLERFRGEK